MRSVVCPTPEALGEAAAAFVAERGREAVAERGAFHVALSGGSTPKLLYRALRVMPLDWTRVHVYFSDERAVGPESPESNYKLAFDELLSHVPVPEGQVHRMKGELDPHLAADEYERELPQQLDLVLLGMGDDGHTASLFPDTEGLSAQGRVVANFVPRLGVWRITMTFDEINAARERVVLAAGEKKAGPLHEVAARMGKYPVERVKAPMWFVDEAAAEL